MLTVKRRAADRGENEPKRVCAEAANAVLAANQEQMQEIHNLRVRREELAVERENVALEREKMALLNEKLKNKLLEMELARARSSTKKRKTRRCRRSTSEEYVPSETESELYTPSEPSLGGFDADVDHSTYPNSKNNSPNQAPPFVYVLIY